MVSEAGDDCNEGGPATSGRGRGRCSEIGGHHSCLDLLFIQRSHHPAGLSAAMRAMTSWPIFS
jgi:hypothetical protein